jgi:hypothetical protein
MKTKQSEICIINKIIKTMNTNKYLKKQKSKNGRNLRSLSKEREKKQTTLYKVCW